MFTVRKDFTAQFSVRSELGLITIWLLSVWDYRVLFIFLILF